MARRKRKAATLNGFDSDASKDATKILEEHLMCKLFNLFAYGLEAINKVGCPPSARHKMYVFVFGSEFPT
jgi:hypothetical protein